MPRIAGITTKKNGRGEITHVTINLQQHRQAIIPLLNQLGIIQKTEFQRECENGYTIEESRKRVHAKIDTLWKK